MSAVIQDFDNASQESSDRPRVILFDTLMGKGVPFFEQREKNHFLKVDAEEWEKAIQILDDSIQEA